MTTRKKEAKATPAAEPKQEAAWQEEAAQLRAEIAELKKRGGDADADVMAGIVTRLASLESKMSEGQTIQLPGGGQIKAPAGSAAPAKAEKPAAKEKEPAPAEKKGGCFWEGGE